MDTKVSAALEEGEKSEIRVIQTWYYCVVSARITCYSIGSEACALLAGLSQPVIGVDRSSDSEVFRVTRGIGQGCSTRFVAFPVAFQISRFRSQNYCGKTTRSRRWSRRRRRCRSRGRLGVAVGVDVAVAVGVGVNVAVAVAVAVGVKVAVAVAWRR